MLLAFPDYFTHMLPLLRLVYLPGRDSWHHLLTGTMVTIPAVAAILMTARKRRSVTIAWGGIAAVAVLCVVLFVLKYVVLSPAALPALG